MLIKKCRNVYLIKNKYIYVMKKNVIFTLLFFTSFITFSQTSTYQKFKKLSSPKKWWVVFHPFKAKKALIISTEIKRISDSIQKTKMLDGDKSGGQVDALRHALWMASLRIAIGKSAARSLGKVHEKENYLYYKANRLEDGSLPDKASMDMDLYNNEVGLFLVNKKEKISNKQLIEKLIRAIKHGKMKVIKKDHKKHFLTCKGKIIEKETLQRKWINNKCLINSNQIAKKN